MTGHAFFRRSRWSDLILHHYDTSPFSEKVRKILGHKRLAWRAVEQPTIMPKPQLTPLTGGYRRIPVLQIGADVYCDSQLIARVLEARQPDPTIFPGGSQGSAPQPRCGRIGCSSCRRSPVLFALIGDAVPQAFIDDRAKMTGGRVDLRRHAKITRRRRASNCAPARRCWRHSSPTAARSSSAMRSASPTPPATTRSGSCGACPAPAPRSTSSPSLSPGPSASSAMGHGQREDMDAAAALQIARESTPLPGRGVASGEPNGLEVGMRVAVMPDDYGFDPVGGELITATTEEVAVRRRDDEIGEVVVHFPRIGFQIRRA